MNGFHDPLANAVGKLSHVLSKELPSLAHAIRDVGKGCNPQKPRIWVLTLGQDEPIPIQQMKLAKPIKPGFRRPVTLTPDEPVDKRDDGTFVAIEVLSGDSQVVYNPASTATSIQVWFYGDGSTGDKSARLTVDGHIGDGDQPVSIDIDWTVTTPDATTLGISEGADEPIPT